MKVDTFFEKFDMLTETPNAVEKLREMVLQFAVQGKLVDQSDADGTADKLLAVIINKHGSEVAGYQEGSKFEELPLRAIPRNWRWALTSALCNLQTGKRMKGGAQESGVISLGGEHLKSDGSIDYTVPRYVSTDFYNEMHSGQVDIHDTLMVKDGATTGKTAFVSALPASGIAAVNEHVFILRWHEPINKQLAFYFIRAFAFTHIAIKSAGLIGGIRREAVLNFPFPLPPLAEQERIVAKVNELMALCDRLEARLQERDTQHTVLARAALARFAEAPTPANLNFLFHDSYAIEPADLRKAILTLAVQGKLVPQDPNDEPAALLLAEIQREKDIAVADRQINPVRACPSAKLDDLDFDLPSGWEVAWICELLMEIQTGPFGSSLHKSDYTLGGTPVVNPASLKDGKIVPIGEMAVGAKTVARLANFKLRAGDIVMARRGEMGRCAIVTESEEGWLCGTGSLVLHLPKGIHAPYLAMLIGSPMAREYLEKASVGTTMNNLNQGILAKMVVGVPPLAEQPRIVDKVDQVMSLIDQLEAQLVASRATAKGLVDAIVAELTAGGATYSNSKATRICP